MQILLASGNQSVVERWKGLLADQNLVEHAPSVQILKGMVADGTFDLILVHRLLIDLPVFAEIRRLAPAVRFFLLSDNPHEEEGLTFLKLGIVGYGNTYISPPRLSEALHVITTGGVWLGQKVIQRLILETHAKAEVLSHDAAQQLSVLTTAERKVAELVARGLTNLEIAAELDIAERTVKAHLTAIYEKMCVPNRLSLALLINQGRNR